MDVVIGYIEPHARPQTMALTEGLVSLPVRTVTYKGLSLKELDLDQALKRRPQLILVDELAHTNAPGSRHLKRYQDVEELLKAGIDVYSTVNVQHLSLIHILIEMTDNAVSKAAALRQLCESRRLANEEVLCFGDSENDLEMLQEFRYGHIMRNAEEPLLAQVNHIAPANTAYGVLRVIENYTGIPIGKEQA